MTTNTLKVLRAALEALEHATVRNRAMDISTDELRTLIASLEAQRSEIVAAEDAALTRGFKDGLLDERKRNGLRITQLEAALVVANSNHEEFERKWYLACDEIEELKETVTQLNRALREEIEAPTFMGEPVSLLREPVKSLADIKVCYCPPDKCQAPVIMGRQVACTRKMHPPAIAAIDSVGVTKT